MGWKTINNRLYYYRNARQNGRVVTTYWGRGDSAWLMAEIDQHEAGDRRARAVLDRERRILDRELDDEIDRLVDAGKDRASDYLKARGFHRHKGQWRKRRQRIDTMNPTANQLPKIPNVSDACPSVTESPSNPRSLFGLDSWTASVVAEKLTGEAVGGDQHTGVVEDIMAHASELAGPNPRPIERTLAESASLAWAALRFTEASELAAGSRSLALAAYSLSRLDHAHRRYVSALKTLAQVRRLSGPSVQVVNIGGQNQTNVIGSPPTMESE